MLLSGSLRCQPRHTMFQRLRFARAFKGCPLARLDQPVDVLDDCPVGALPIHIVVPGMLGENQLHSSSCWLCSTAGCQLSDGLEEAVCIFRTTEKVGGFLKRLIVFKRHHDDRALISAGDDDRGMVIADLFHGFRKVIPGLCVWYGVHLVSLILHMHTQLWRSLLLTGPLGRNIELEQFFFRIPLAYCTAFDPLES